MYKANLSIIPSPEDLDLDDALITMQDIENGYVFTVPDFRILKTEDYERFMKDVQKQIGIYIKYDYSSNKNKVFYKIISKNYKMYITGTSEELSCVVYATNEETANKIWTIYVKYLREDKNVKIFIENYYMTNSSLSNKTKELKIKDIAYISKLYYPYINTDLMFDQLFTGAENILLLVGDAGIGKSKLATLALKYAVENPDKIPYDKTEENILVRCQYINAVFIKGTDVLARDDFWRSLEDEPPDFVIIDDLDYMLTKRDADVQSSDDIDKNKFLNQFLSFTDGVEKYKTKFIITTNQSYSEIDTALLRKGRLFDILELRELKSDEALEIWKENDLENDDFYNIFKNDVVLPAELGSEINKRLNKRIKNATASYLFEKNISKIQKAKRSRQIGL